MSKLHKKPTNEEIEQEIQVAMDEFEKTKEPEVEVPVETPVEEPVTTETPVETELVIETSEETPEIDQSEELKKKLSASARENQKILAKNKILNKAVEQAATIEDPTENDLMGEFPDWNEMTETEKRLAKSAYISSKRFEVIHEAAKVGQKIEKWGEDVDKYIDNPATFVTNPELDGKQEKFRLFANLEGNHGTSLDTLTKAFLYMESTAKPKNKGAMFETGSGGPNDKLKPPSDKLTVGQAESLKKTDYKKYKEYLVAGKIDFGNV